MAEGTRISQLTRELAKVQELSDQRDFDYTTHMDKHDSSIDEMAKALTELSRKNERIDEMYNTLAELSRNVAKLQLQQNSAIGSSNSNQNSIQVRIVKVNFPKFDGTDALNWIFRAEQYFSYYQMTDDQKVVLASVNMEGDIIPWFQMMNHMRQASTWAALVWAVEQQFGPTQFENSRAQLFKLSQTGSVQEYHTRFMVLANRVEGVMADAFIDCFISGLREDLRREVMSREPLTLSKAAALARLLDKKTSSSSWGFLKNRGATASPATKTGVGTSPMSSSVTAKASLPPLLPTPNSKPMAPIKKLMAAEIQLKREKGLCLTCDQKFSATHHCPNRQYLMLQYEPDETIEDSMEEETQGEARMDTAELHHLSMNTIHGTPALMILFSPELLTT
ncbi:uncharacterized protein LOC129320773 isoform X2 [Prosopis cineraria]|uniref:uncharacterized protein LOC129320773 isoform X2 n=1 Tax=Prosopis cineraria TaxID=364024 RepID=UPI00240FDE0C|nr:uncharacterized protein LOC129320773 isoform X2 [Prosopis cineraria]